MQKILYFNKEGYCTKYRDNDSIFSIMCSIPEELTEEDLIGMAIEEFVCSPRFKIINGRHVNKENPW
jgi:hypothetical protein